MHLQRVITGIVALPFLIYLIGKGGFYFSALIAGACLLSLWEYFRIAFDSHENATNRLFPIIISLSFGAALIWASYRGSSSLLLGILYSHLIACGVFSLTRFRSDPQVIRKVSVQIMGMNYISLSFSLLVVIRNTPPDGMVWIFWIIGIIFAGDIGAFYVGRSLGRHKLCPSVSPGKTIEGAVGGLMANILLGAVVKFFFLKHLPWGKSLLFFVFLGIAGQIGDLFESEFKRAAGVKDSGTILPGHGGILDRVDALLFATPVAFLFKKFVLV